MTRKKTEAIEERTMTKQQIEAIEKLLDERELDMNIYFDQDYADYVDFQDLGATGFIRLYRLLEGQPLKKEGNDNE